MLQFIRHSIGSWIVKGLFVVLIASFAVWGIGDIFRVTGTDTVVATVGKREITAVELEQEFNNQIRFLQQRYQVALEYRRARELGLLETALDTLIERAMYEEVARDLDLEIDPMLIRERAEREPAFQDEFGRFDPELLERAFGEGQGSQETYISNLKRQISLELLLSPFSNGVKVPRLVERAVEEYANQARTFQRLILPYPAVDETTEPEEATLKAYYEENKERFMVEESREALVAVLTSERFFEQSTVEDETLQAEFESRYEELSQPERRSVRNIVLESESKAEELIDLAHRKTTEEGEEDGLEAAAETLGYEIHAFSRFSREGLSDLGDAAYALEEDEIGAPLETPLGWHVLQVTEILPQQEVTFEESKEELLQTLKQEQALDRLYDTANRLDSALARQVSLAEIAERLDISLTEVTVDASGRDREGSVPPLLHSYPEITEEIFVLERDQVGFVNEITLEEETVFFAVEVTQEYPSQERLFEESQEDVLRAWEEDRRRREGEDRAREIRVRLDHGSTLEDLAERQGLEFRTEGPMKRSDIPDDFPQTLREALFDLPLGKAAIEAIEEGVMVIQVIAIDQAESARITPEQIQASLATDIANEYQRAFAQDLRRRFLDRDRSRAT